MMSRKTFFTEAILAWNSCVNNANKASVPSGSKRVRVLSCARRLTGKPRQMEPTLIILLIAPLSTCNFCSVWQRRRRPNCVGAKINISLAWALKITHRIISECARKKHAWMLARQSKNTGVKYAFTNETIFSYLYRESVSATTISPVEHASIDPRLQ